MQPFAFARANTLADATTAAADRDTALIAGGTELVNWLKEGIVAPRRLVDINSLPGLQQIDVTPSGLTIGALARMSDVAQHEGVRQDYPAIAQALEKSASPQLRNMASMGGNLLQRTRCPYFRAEADLPCNKRRLGSGCAARDGEDRAMAVFGWSDRCLATHPSDVAVALVALDVRLMLEGPQGSRVVPLSEFYLLPGETPDRETVLEPGELITRIHVPFAPVARRSQYLKVRERASYEFALVSAAVAVDLDGTIIRNGRVALGGVAPKPWRLERAESALRGVEITRPEALRAAIEPAFDEARPRRHNAFKIELAKRAVVRALETAGGAS
jgi:xanthine dehydrogenase YagS FAD-binding subunit